MILQANIIEMFPSYAAFVFTIIGVTFLAAAIFIILILVIVRHYTRKNLEQIDETVEAVQEALKEKECEFCGALIQPFITECPNCSAPVKAKE